MAQSIPQPTVAIITVTYNCYDFIEAYLDSIYPILISNKYHLILVDNNSSDGSVQLIKQHATLHNVESHITLYCEKTNAGFGKGCNRAAVIAEEKKIPYLWFLNPDTIINQHSGSALLSLLQSNKNTHFAGSLLSDEQGEIRAGGFRFPSITNILISTSRLKILDKLLPSSTTAIPIEHQPYKAEWLTGASFMTHQKHFKLLNGFSPCYFLYFEEVDLFFRAKQKNLNAYCCPSSTVVHASGASTGVSPNNPCKPYPTYWFESRRRFYTKNYGTIYFIAADICVLFFTALWKCRAKVQRKIDDTPKDFLTGIVRHSYIGTQIKKGLEHLGF